MSAFLRAEADRLREQAIQQAMTDMVSAKTREKQIEAMNRMYDLIDQRSADQVARMEKEKGLR